MASEDLDGVMATIHDADSPVEARRALKIGFGFTGRQAALLLTLPVLSFTRSERERVNAGRRARMELLADVTGAIPAIREPVVDSGAGAYEPSTVEANTVGSSTVERSMPELSTVETSTAEASTVSYETTAVKTTTASHQTWAGFQAESAPDMSGWGDEFDGTVDRMRSMMDQHYGVAGAPVASVPTAPVQPTAQTAPVQATAPTASTEPSLVSGEQTRAGRRSADADAVESATVLDEQIGELCDAIGELLSTETPATAWLDDPRDSSGATGRLLDSCGVDDATGIRTLLWHLRRTGLDTVDGLLPFAEPLTGSRGFDVQAARFESAMESGGLGAVPGTGATWTGRLWPIAEKLGYGYAVHYRPGPGAGAVWAYGGGEPLHLLWDSVVDMLVELYQALTAGEPCDAALAAVVDGRVVWTNIS